MSSIFKFCLSLVPCSLISLVIRLFLVISVLFLPLLTHHQQQCSTFNLSPFLLSRFPSGFSFSVFICSNVLLNCNWFFRTVFEQIYFSCLGYPHYESTCSVDNSASSPYDQQSSNHVNVKMRNKNMKNQINNGIYVNGVGYSKDKGHSYNNNGGKFMFFFTMLCQGRGCN